MTVLQYTERPKPTSKDMCLLTYQQAWDYQCEIERRVENIPDFLFYYTMEWLWEQIAKGHVQVWTVGPDLIILTRVLNFPNTNVLQVFGAEGSDIFHYLETVWEVFSKFAVLYNCPRIEVVGRSGWERALRRLSGLKIDQKAVVFSFPVRITKGH